MATHGDYDGVWFTIQAIRMYHREALEDVSFVVIDNDPEGPTSTALREIGNWVPRLPPPAINGDKHQALDFAQMMARARSLRMGVRLDRSHRRCAPSRRPT